MKTRLTTLFTTGPLLTLACTLVIAAPANAVRNAEDSALKVIARFYNAVNPDRVEATAFKNYNPKWERERNSTLISGPDQCSFSFDKSNMRITSYISSSYAWNKRQIDSLRTTYFGSERDAIEGMDEYRVAAGVPSNWVFITIEIVEDSVRDGKFSPGLVRVEFAPPNATVAVNYQERVRFTVDPHDGTLLTFSRTPPITISARNFILNDGDAAEIASRYMVQMRKSVRPVGSRVDIVVSRDDMGRLTSSGTKRALLAWIITFSDDSWVAVDVQDGSVLTSAIQN